jgi:hypothetical protein
MLPERRSQMPEIKKPELEKTESQIQAEIRKAVGALPDVRLWRQNTGQFPVVDVRALLALLGRGEVKKAIALVKSARPVVAGMAVGSADLIGIVGPHGRFLSIEVKTAKGRVSEAQEDWARIVRSRGGVAGIARSVEDALELVEKARRLA